MKKLLTKSEHLCYVTNNDKFIQILLILHNIRPKEK
nr:MAG TPA: hypothetical protein [Caudoviricetes sp.]